MQLKLILVMKNQLTGDFSFQASLYTHVINMKFPLIFVLQAKGD